MADGGGGHDSDRSDTPVNTGAYVTDARYDAIPYLFQTSDPGHCLPSTLDVRGVLSLTALHAPVACSCGWPLFVQIAI